MAAVGLVHIVADAIIRWTGGGGTSALWIWGVTGLATGALALTVAIMLAGLARREFTALGVFT